MHEHGEEDIYAQELRLNALSPREKQIARLVWDGLSNEEIAEALQISVSGVNYQVGNLKLKLHAPNRSILIRRLIPLFHRFDVVFFCLTGLAQAGI